MKKFLKRFMQVLLVIVIIILVGYSIFKSTYVPTHLSEHEVEEIVITEPVIEEEEEVIEEVIIPPTEEELWKEQQDASDRVNVLLFGTDGQRADTLLFLSYSKKDNDISMVTVPRDTKHVVEGMDALGQDKINAVFCFRGEMGGSEKQKEAVEEILGVDIHYYVKVNYYSIRAIVNTLGGIEINVHRDMDYDDEWADPPLNIHIDKGYQTLNGNKAMEYMRWRKNNDGSGDSDIQRTKRQQEFLIKIMKKSFGLNIVKVIEICYDYVKTDMSLQDLIYYGTDMIGFDLDSINKYSLPGEADYRYFYQNEEETKELMKKIYNNSHDESDEE